MKLDELIIDNQEVELKYHTHFNPRLWSGAELLPDVDARLLLIVKTFIKEIHLPVEVITDIIMTGSNASYNWTNVSDIDIHIIVDYDKLMSSNAPYTKMYFDTIRKLWNKEHNITVNDLEVELYIQDVKEPHESKGQYSLYYRKWLSFPVYAPFENNDAEVTQKVKSLMNRIDSVSSYQDAELVIDKLSKMRKQGLQRTGEGSVENLAFKVLRQLKYIDKLHKMKSELYDKNHSM